MNTKTAKETSNKEHAFLFSPAWQSGRDWETISVQLFERWKKVITLGVQILEEAAGSSAKIRSAQLAAGQEMQTKALDLRKSMAEAKTPLELWTLQINWALGNLNQSLHYWQTLIEATNESNRKIYSRVQEHA